MTARKKFRGGSACAASASNSENRRDAFAASTSRRARATASLSLAFIAPIVAAAAALLPAQAWAAGPPSARPAVAGRLSAWVVVVAAAAIALFFLWTFDVIRPGSLQRRARRQPHVIPGAVWLCCAAMLFLGANAAAAAVHALPSRFVGPPDSLRHTACVGLAMTAAGLAIAGFLLFLLRPHGDGDGAMLGLRVRWTDAPTGLLAFALAAPVVLLVMLLSTLVFSAIARRPPDAIAHDTLRQIAFGPPSTWRWLAIAVAVAGAPIIEELTYRLFLQSFLITVLRSRGLGIAVAAAAFAGMHVGAAEPVALPGLFVLGAALGIAYERTARLGVPIVMHAAFNAANILVATGALPSPA